MIQKEYDVWVIMNSEDIMTFEFAYTKKESAQVMADFINEQNNAKLLQCTPVHIHHAKLILQDD